MCKRKTARPRVREISPVYLWWSLRGKRLEKVMCFKSGVKKRRSDWWWQWWRWNIRILGNIPCHVTIRREILLTAYSAVAVYTNQELLDRTRSNNPCSGPVKRVNMTELRIPVDGDTTTLHFLQRHQTQIIQACLVYVQRQRDMAPAIFLSFY